MHILFMEGRRIDMNINHNFPALLGVEEWKGGKKGISNIEQGMSNYQVKKRAGASPAATPRSKDRRLSICFEIWLLRFIWDLVLGI